MALPLSPLARGVCCCKATQDHCSTLRCQRGAHPPTVCSHPLLSSPLLSSLLISLFLRFLLFLSLSLFLALSLSLSLSPPPSLSPSLSLSLPLSLVLSRWGPVVGLLVSPDEVQSLSHRKLNTGLSLSLS